MRIAGLYQRNVVTADRMETVARAAKRMRLHGISALPVIEHDRIIGIVTERDITGAVALDLNPKTTVVADIMTQHPLVVTPDESTEVVAMRMLEHGIRHLPVVDDHRVLGVISARDLLMLEAWHPALTRYA